MINLTSRLLFFATQGNGIQAAFEEDPNVLYISIHRYENASFYPHDTSGSYSSKGGGRGLGLYVPPSLVRSGSPPPYLTTLVLLSSSVNIPWSKGGKGDGDYLYAFDKMVMPIAKEFIPDIVLGR